MADIDWNKIKHEYITTSISYRKLAKKYEVSETTLGKKAGREDWVSLRQQANDKRTTKVINAAAKKDKRFFAIVDKLLVKIEDVIEDGSVFTQPQNIKSISSALKDIRDIKGIKSAKDLEEQQARIEKLRKDSDIAEKRFELDKQRAGLDQEDEDDETGVILLPPVMSDEREGDNE